MPHMTALMKQWSCNITTINKTEAFCRPLERKGLTCDLGKCWCHWLNGCLWPPPSPPLGCNTPRRSTQAQGGAPAGSERRCGSSVCWWRRSCPVQQQPHHLHCMESRDSSRICDFLMPNSECRATKTMTNVNKAYSWSRSCSTVLWCTMAFLSSNSWKISTWLLWFGWFTTNK